MRELDTDEGRVVQVLDETFEQLRKYRLDGLGLRSKRLSGITLTPLQIDFDYKQRLWALVVYPEFETEPPLDISPESLAAKLFRMLAEMHKLGEFLGALNYEGVAFTPHPQFFDLSLAPLISLAPTSIIDQVRQGTDYVLDQVLIEQQPSVLGDLFCVAQWLAARFPELEEQPTLKAILSQSDQAKEWLATDVCSALTDSMGVTLNDVVEETASPAKSVSPEVNETTMEHKTRDLGLASIANSNQRSGLELDDPSDEPSSSTGKDTSRSLIRFRLLTILLVLMIVSYFAANYLVATFVVPNLERSQSKLTPDEAAARSKFQDVLLREQSRAR